MPWPSWLNIGCRKSVADPLHAAPEHNADREIVLLAAAQGEFVAETVQIAPEHKADRGAKKASRDAARAKAHVGAARANAELEVVATSATRADVAVVEKAVKQKGSAAQRCTDRTSMWDGCGSSTEKEKEKERNKHGKSWNSKKEIHVSLIVC